MLVYRIEDEKGRGPYQEYSVEDWAIEPHDTTTGRPTPYFEKWYVVGDSWRKMQDRCTTRFGFPSRRLMKKWFKAEERSNLKSLGFHLAIYNSDKIILGDAQCMFDATLSVKLSQEEL